MVSQEHLKFLQKDNNLKGDLVAYKLCHETFAIEKV